MLCLQFVICLEDNAVDFSSLPFCNMEAPAFHPYDHYCGQSDPVLLPNQYLTTPNEWLHATGSYMFLHSYRRVKRYIITAKNN